MKRVVLVALLAVSMVMVLAVTGFSYAGMFYESGYLVPDTDLRGALLDKTGGSIEAIEVSEYDQIFVRGSSLYVGTEDDRRAYSDEFPMYINGGAGVRFFDDSNALFNCDFQSNRSYKGLAVNNGVAFNEDYTRSDFEEYVITRLANGLFINSGYMYADTFIETFNIPGNSILNLQENFINYYSLENGVFVYHDIKSIEPGDVVRIGSAELSYGELLHLLGVVSERTDSAVPGSSGEDENEPVVEPYDSGVNASRHEQTEPKEIEKTQEIVSEPSGEEGAEQEPEQVYRPQARPESQISTGSKEEENDPSFDIVDDPASEAGEMEPGLQPGEYEPGEAEPGPDSEPLEEHEPSEDLPAVDPLPEEEDLPPEDTGTDIPGGEQGSDSDPGTGGSGSSSGGSGGGGGSSSSPGSQGQSSTSAEAEGEYKLAPDDYYQGQPQEQPRKPETVKRPDVVEIPEYVDPTGKPSESTTPPKNPEWEMPVVTPGDLFNPGVYSVTFSLTVHDPANVIVNGITYEVEKKSADGTWSLYNRKSYSDMSNDVEISYIFPSLEPDSTFRIRGYFKYKDENDRVVNEAKVFQEWREFSTKPVSELGDIILDDMELDTAELSGDNISIPHLKFSDKSDPDATGSISRIIVRFTRKGTEQNLNPDTKAAVLSQNIVDTLKTLQAVSFSSKSGKVTLDRGTSYIISVICEDRYGTEINIKNNTGISRTCNLLPTADITVTNNESDTGELTQTVSFSVSNPDQLELKNYKLEIWDINGDSVSVNGSTSLSVVPGENLHITTLRSGRNYTAVIYADCDTNDGQGTFPRQIGRKSFVSSALANLGPVYLTVNNISSKVCPLELYRRAVFELSLNSDMMGENPKILQHVDRMQIGFQLGDDSTVIVLSDAERQKLLKGDTIVFDTDKYAEFGLTIKSKSKYRLNIKAFKIYDAQAHETEEIKVNSSLTSFSTQITPHVTRAEVTAMTGYLSVKAQIKDVDDYIVGNTALIQVYKQGERRLELVSAFRMDKNTDSPVVVKLTPDPEKSSDGQNYNIEADTQYVVRIVAEEAETEKGLKNNYVLLEINDASSKTTPAITGNILFGGLKDEGKTNDSGAPLYKATLYMDLLDPTNTLRNKKKIYVEESRITPSGKSSVTGNEPLVFEYSSETFDTADGWKSEDNVFYSDSYAAEHQEEFVHQLPYGYTRLDYIETRAIDGTNNGSGYINTGIPAREGYTLTVRYQSTAVREQWIAGNIAAGMQIKINSNGTPNTTLAKHNNTVVGQVDIAVATASKTDNHPIYLFAADNNGQSSDFAVMRLYDAVISDGENPIVNYVPCINPNGKIGLFDLAAPPENAFVEAIGTVYAGTEIALTLPSEPEEVEGPDLPDYGEIPSKYRQVEFIESHGPEYIDTGIKPSASLRVDAVLSYCKLNSKNMAFGVSSASAYASGNNYVFDVVSNKFYITCGNGGGVSATSNIPAPLLFEKYKVTFNPDSSGALYINDELACTSTNTRQFPNYNVFLFGRNIAGSKDSTASWHFAGRIYNCKFTEDGVLKRNFVPVYYIAEDKYGMYDTVTGTFFGNMGAGAFTGSEDPYQGRAYLPDRYRKVDYIKTDGTQYLDTGYAPQNGTNAIHLFVDYSYDSSSSWRVHGISRSSAGVHVGLNSSTIYYMAGSGGDRSTGAKVSMNHRLQFDLDCIARTYNVYDVTSGATVLDNQNLTVGTNTATPAHILLFTWNTSSSATPSPGSNKTVGKLYGAKIWDDGVLQRDFIPVFDFVSGKYGLYDYIEDKFYDYGNSSSAFGGDTALTGYYTRSQDRMSFSVDVLQDSRIADSYEFSMYYIINEGTDDEIEIPISSTSFTTEQEVDTIASGVEFVAKGSNNKKYVVINDISLSNVNATTYRMDTFNAQVDFQGFAFDISGNNYSIINTTALGSSISNAVIRLYFPLRRTPFSTNPSAWPDIKATGQNNGFGLVNTHRGLLQNVRFEMTQEQYPYLYAGGQYWSDLSPTEIQQLQDKMALQTEQQSKGTLVLDEGEILASEQLANSRYYTARWFCPVYDMYGTVENFVTEFKTPVMAFGGASGVALDMQAGAVVQNGYIYGSFNDSYSAELTLLSSSNLSDISSYKSIGGVAGYITGKGALIQNVYALADIKYKCSGTETFNRMGGIVGWNKGSGAMVQNCYVVGDTVQEATGKPASSNYGPAVGENASSGTVQNVFYLSDCSYDGTSNKANVATTLLQVRNITWQNNVINKNKRFNVDAAMQVYCYPQLSYTSNVMPPQQMIPLPELKLDASQWDVVYAYTYENDPSNPTLNDILMPHVSLDAEGNPSKLDWNTEDETEPSSDEQVICVMIADAAGRQVWSVSVEAFDIQPGDVLADIKDGQGISMVYVRVHDPEICKTNYRITGVTFADDAGNATQESILQDARYAYVEYYKRIDDADGINGWTSFRMLPGRTDGGTCEENFALSADIDLSGKAFNELSWCKMTYTGKVDGNGYTVRNIDYDNNLGKKLGLNTLLARQEYRDTGIFGHFRGVASDLFIENVSIEAGDRTGILAGWLDGANVENVYIKGSYACGGSVTGGLSAVITQSNVFNCGVTDTKVVNTGNGETNGGSTATDNYSTAMVFGAGGFAGTVENFTDIVRCYTSDVYVEAQGGFMAGGFAGYVLPDSANSNIRGCCSTGEVVSINDFTGGFIGYNGSAIIIQSCYSDTDLYVFSSASGGFFGGNANGNYSKLLSFGNVVSMKLHETSDDELALHSLQALCGKTLGTVTGYVSKDAEIILDTAGSTSVNRMGDPDFTVGAELMSYANYADDGAFICLSSEYFVSRDNMLPLVADENQTVLPGQKEEHAGFKDTAADVSVQSAEISKEAGGTYYVKVQVCHDPAITITGAETDFGFVDEETNLVTDQDEHQGMVSFTSTPSFTQGAMEKGYGYNNDKRVTTLHLKGMTLNRARDTYWLVGITYRNGDEQQEHFMRAAKRLTGIECQWKNVMSSTDWERKVNSSHLENFRLCTDIDFTGRNISAASGTANMIINRLVGQRGTAEDYNSEENRYYTLSGIYVDEETAPVDLPYGWQTNNSSGFIRAITGELCNVTFDKVALRKQYSTCNGIIIRNTGTVSGVRFTACNFTGRAGASCIQRTRGDLNHIYLADIKSSTTALNLSGVLTSMFEANGYNSAFTDSTVKQVKMHDTTNNNTTRGGLITYACCFERQYYANQVGQTDNNLSVSRVTVSDSEITGMANQTGLVVSVSGRTDISDVEVSNSSINRTTSINYPTVGLILGCFNSANEASITITGCKVENCTVNCPGGDDIGGIAGYIQSSPGSFSGNSTQNVTICGRSYVGGLIGDAYNTTCTGCIVKESSISGTSNGTTGCIGGAFGRAGYGSKTVSEVTVDNTFVTNSGSGNYTGGIWGIAENGYNSVYNKLIRSTVTSRGNYTAGLGCGSTTNSLFPSFSYVENCTIRGASYVGGLLSSGYPTKQDNTVENTIIVGTGSYVGGAMGYVAGGKADYVNSYSMIDNGTASDWIKNCKIYGESSVGGAYGATGLSPTEANSAQLRWGCIVQNCDVRGNRYVGGALGGKDDDISNVCYAYVQSTYISQLDPATRDKYGIGTTNQDSRAYFGTVFGYAATSDSCEAENCLVYAPSAEYVGGIGGRIAARYYASRNGAGLISKDCVVIGGRYVGGLFGTIRPEFNATYAVYNGTDDAYRSVVRDCYSNALVYGSDMVAGIAGAYEAESGTVKISGVEVTGIFTPSALVKNVYFTGGLTASAPGATAANFFASVSVKSDKNQIYTPDRWYMKLQGIASFPASISASTVLPTIDSNALGYLNESSSLALLTGAYSGSASYVKLYSTTELADKFLTKILNGPSSNFHYTSIADSGEGAKYKQLEYIESTGTQYIDTGIYPTTNTVATMLIDLQDRETLTQGIFGSRGTANTADSKAYNLWYNADGNIGKISSYWTGSTSKTAAIPETGPVYASLRTGGASWINGTSLTGATKVDCAYSLYLFGMQNAATDVRKAKLRLYTTNIFKDGALVRNYIPVTDENGVAGLYDTVSKTFFYYNDSTGEQGFTAGAAVPVGETNGFINYAPVTAAYNYENIYEGNSKANVTVGPYTGHRLSIVFNQGVYLPGTTQYTAERAKLQAIYNSLSLESLNTGEYPEIPRGIGPTGFASDAVQNAVWNNVTLKSCGVKTVSFSVLKALFAMPEDDAVETVRYKITKTVKSTGLNSEDVTVMQPLTENQIEAPLDRFSLPLTYNYEDEYTVTLEIISESGDRVQYVKVFTAEDLRLPDKVATIPGSTGETSKTYWQVGSALYLVDPEHPGSLPDATLVASGVSHIYKDTESGKLLVLKKGGRIIPDISDFEYGDLPEGYTKLDCIYTTGEQYLDTGYAPQYGTNSIRLFVDYAYSSSSGWRVHGISSGGAGVHVGLNSSTIYYMAGTGGDRSAGATVSMNHRLQFDLDCISGTYNVYDVTSRTKVLDNKTVTIGTNKITPAHILLFTWNTSTTATSSSGSNKTIGRLYGAKIWDNGVLERDYIPAIDANGVAGLYDLINDEFCVSSTATPFVAGTKLLTLKDEETTWHLERNILYRDGVFFAAGVESIQADSSGTLTLTRLNGVTKPIDYNYEELPAGYRELDCVYTTGEQYVDTGYAPQYGTNAIRLFVDYSYASSSSWRVHGISSGGAGVHVGLNNSTVYYMAGTGGDRSVEATVSMNHRLQFDLDCVTGKYNVYDVTASAPVLENKTVAIGSNKITSAHILLFTWNSTTSAVPNPGSNKTVGKLYAAKIWDDGVLQRDLVPAIDSNGAVGLYDRVYDNFYTSNTGTPLLPGAYSITAGTDTYRLERNVLYKNGNQIAAGIASVEEAGNGKIIIARAAKPDEKFDLSTFDYSALPAGYTKRDYVRTTGEQYVDTGYAANFGTNLIRLFVDYSYDSSSSWRVHGISRSSAGVHVGLNSSTIYYMAGSGGDRSAGATVSMNHRLQFDLDCIARTYKVYDVTSGVTLLDIQDLAVGTSTATPAHILLFTWNTSSSATPSSGSNKTVGKLYGAKIWDEGHLQRDFVPVTDANGVVGLYDLVYQKFYTSNTDKPLLLD